MLQLAKNGAVSEYADMDEAIAPQLLYLMGEWILR